MVETIKDGGDQIVSEESKKNRLADGLSLPAVVEARSQKSSQRSRLNPKVAKVRKVNNYIIFYNELIGEGQFGTVVKAQLAADLLSADNSAASGGQKTVRSTVDPDKTIYACKIIDSASFTEKEQQLVFKEV